MASFIDFRNPPGSDRRADSAFRATSEPLWVRRMLIGIVRAFFILFLGLPLVVVFQGALAKGTEHFVAVFRDYDILHSILMTLTVTLISVPANTLFGIAAAWSITRYRFFGRQALLALIDLPLWVSPVIGGLVYVLLYGRRGYMGPWLQAHDIKIIFALPGMVLATTFVTFPFVARSLIPLMQAQGCEEEEAALTLGAGGFQILRRITLPKIKWGLFYGVILGLFLVAFFLRRVGGHAVFTAAILAEMAVLTAFFAFDRVGYLWYNLIGCTLCVAFSLLLQAFLPSRPPSSPEAVTR
jgi:sulfate transport system permease protein